MVKMKLLSSVAFVLVGIITMFLGKMFAKTWSDLILGSVSGALLIVIGVAFFGVWLVDLLRKKDSTFFR